MIGEVTVKSFLPGAPIFALVVATSTAIAQDSRTPSEGNRETTGTVHVQPRGQHFAPDSARDADVQRKLDDFNEAQRAMDKKLDKKLIICRRC